MSPKRHVLSILLGLFLLGLTWPALAAEEPPTLTAQVLHSQSAYRQGASHALALRLNVRPGFHINDPHPTEPDIFPTKLTFAPNPNLVFSPPVFPSPRRYQPGFAAKPMEVHDGVVTVRLTFKVADKAAPGPHLVKAKLEFQACDDQTCLMPESLEVPLTITVAPAGKAGQPLNKDVFGPASQPKGKR